MSFYVAKIKGNFYFRIRIPQDLQQHFPSQELKRSLRTKNINNAKSLGAILSSKTEKVFMTLRASLLAPEQIQDYIRRELPSLWRKSNRDLIVQNQREEQQKKSKQLGQVIEEFIQVSTGIEN